MEEGTHNNNRRPPSRPRERVGLARSEAAGVDRGRRAPRCSRSPKSLRRWFSIAALCFCSLPTRRRAEHTVDLPCIISQLNELPPSELEKLASDEVALSEFFQKLDFCKTSRGRRDILSKQNVDLAASNVEKLQKVEAKRAQLEELRQQYSQMHAVAAAEMKAYKEQQQARSPEAIMEMLTAGAKEMESESERSASNMKMGQLDIRQFVSQHVDERKHYHQALILKERMRESLKTRQSYGNPYGAQR